MAELERKANKRLKILEDYEARKQSLEDHAVRLLLKTAAPNANLPMIPSVNSARYRMNCGWCSQSFWGVSGQGLCPACTEKSELQQKLNVELAAIRREVELATAQAAVSRLEELRKEDASPEEILKAFKDVPTGYQDW